MSGEWLQPRLISISHSQWKAKVVVRSTDVAHVETDDMDRTPAVPSLESLTRRHAAGSSGWLGEWLADDADPTQPLP